MYQNMALESNNRLNLPNMVDRQLKISIDKPMGFDANNLSFFDPSIRSTDVLDLMQNESFIAPRPTNIATSINSIVATVHKNLKERNRRVTRPPVEKTPPDPTVTIPNKSNDNSNNKNNDNVNKFNINANNNDNNKANNRKPNSSVKPQQKVSPSNASTSAKKKISVNLQNLYRPSRNKSIAQIKVSADRKRQQRLYRCPSKPLDTSHYETQKRLRTVLHQKRMLEEILKEHEKIQQDRRNISMEIQTMKQYLAEIRGKLDSSLKKLNVKKLITEKYPKHKKKLIPVQSNISTGSSAKGFGTNMKSIAINSHTVSKGAPQN